MASLPREVLARAATGRLGRVATNNAPATKGFSESSGGSGDLDGNCVAPRQPVRGFVPRRLPSVCGNTIRAWWQRSFWIGLHGHLVIVATNLATRRVHVHQQVEGAGWATGLAHCDAK